MSKYSGSHSKPVKPYTNVDHAMKFDKNYLI